MKNTTFRKIIFFWLTFHLIAFISFKLQWTPSFENREGSLTTTDYLLTPKYDYYGRLEGSHNCFDCNYKEDSHFYPFHKFTYGWGTYHYQSKGFVGIFGYYGNNEFIVYVVIPLLIYLLTLLYRKLFKTNN